MANSHRKRTFTITVTVALAFATLLVARDSEPSQRLVTPLVKELEPLRDDFNQASGSPRLVVVLSPT